MKNFRNRFVYFIFAGATCFVFAAELKTSGLPALMHSFYGSLLQLKPFMTSFDEFKDEKNKKQISETLRDLEKTITQNEVKEIEEKPGFRVTYNLMARYLRDTQKLFEAKAYDSAWQQLNATTQFCIACHTRLPEKTNQAAFAWAKLKEEKTEPESLRDAEFYYLAHEYGRAIEIYDGKVRGFRKNLPAKLSDDELLQIYQRKLAYFARVERDPQKAIESLTLDLSNKDLPPRVQEDINIWIGAFSEIKKEAKANFSKASDAALIKYTKPLIEKTSGTSVALRLEDVNTIKVFFASGLLYERIFKQKTSTRTPEMLYLLAQAERQLVPFRLYSLADIYLQECVSQFPKSTIAKQCFEEYSTHMKVRYGGAAPELVNSSIEVMRKKLEAK